MAECVGEKIKFSHKYFFQRLHQADDIGNFIPDFMSPRCMQLMISKQNSCPLTSSLRKTIMIDQNKEKSVGALDFEVIVRMSHKCRMVGRPCGQFQG